MEHETNEMLEATLGNESVSTNRKSPKAVLLGAAVAISALFIAFRKKINAKVENCMVKRLTKKGYIVSDPIKFEDLPDTNIEIE